eukprot:Skav233235  [mRNA]  locus=scaffold2149:15694:25883:- [translate_table: standard]
MLQPCGVQGVSSRGSNAPRRELLGARSEPLRYGTGWRYGSQSSCRNLIAPVALSAAGITGELLEVVAENAGVAAADILDVDLCLMDSTPPCRIGREDRHRGAFVSTPRIDNVLSTWAAFDGLAAVVEEEA